MEDLNHLTATTEDIVSWCTKFDEQNKINGAGKERILSFNTNFIIKINDAALVKFGRAVTASEAASQQFAYEKLQSVVPQVSVPRVYKYFERTVVSGENEYTLVENIGYLVMEYIHGRVLDVSATGFADHLDKISKVTEAIWQIVSEKPGPIDGGEPTGQIWAPDWRSYETLKDKKHLEEYFNRALQKENARMDLTAFPLVYCHLDLAPRNIIIGDDSTVYILDWACAGFYPKAFEMWGLRASNTPEFAKALLSALPKPTAAEEELHYTLWQGYRINMMHELSYKLRDTSTMQP